MQFKNKNAFCTMMVFGLSNLAFIGCKTENAATSDQITYSEVNTKCNNSASTNDITISNFTMEGIGGINTSRNVNYTMTFSEALYGSAVYCLMGTNNALSFIELNLDKIAVWLVVDPENPTYNVTSNIFFCRASSGLIPTVTLYCSTTCDQNSLPFPAINMEIMGDVSGNACEL